MTSSIPYLQFDAFVVDLQLSDSKVDADSRQETLVEDVVGKPAQNVGLACTTVADDQNLEDVVVFLVHAVFKMIALNTHRSDKSKRDFLTLEAA